MLYVSQYWAGARLQFAAHVKTVALAVTNRNDPRPSDSFRAALHDAGFDWVEGKASVGVVVLPGSFGDDSDAAQAELRRLQRRVLAGGGLLVLAGPGTYDEGPRFLSAFGLETYREPLAGPLDVEPTGHPACAGLGGLRMQAPLPVSGAGYSLLEAADRTVGLAAPRGEGRIVLLGTDLHDLEELPQLAVACLDWISAKGQADLR